MHILITGASKGIGFAIAKAFARTHSSQTQLSICARSSEEIQLAQASLQANGQPIQIFATTCDVSHSAEVTEFIDEAQRRFGTVDILVNNAGFGIFRPIEQMTTEEFDSVLNVNLRGVALMTKSILPGMIQRGAGTVITISSLAGKNGFAGGTAYCTAKFGVRGLMQSIFLDVRQHNVRAITIFPGSVDTEFFNERNGAGTLRSKNTLHAEDVANCVYFVSQLPVHADLSELDLRPTNPKG